MEWLAPPAFPTPRDIELALADPAIAGLLAAGAPVIAAWGAPPDIAFANPAALAFFRRQDAAALTQALFASSDPGARRLTELATILRPGAPVRLEKLRFVIGRKAEILTCMCRRTEGTAPLLVVGALGVRLAASNPPMQPIVLSAEPVPSNKASGLSEAAPAEPPADLPASIHALEPELPGASQRSIADEKDPHALRSLEDTQAELLNRFAKMPSVRFLWRSDAAGRLTDITGQLCDVVGCDSAALIGQDFAAHVKRWGADPEDLLALALARRETWSGLHLLWPISGSGAAVPVTLGGVPSFDKARAFDGFRGFGVVQFQNLEPFAPPVVPAQPQGAPGEDIAASMPVPEEVAHATPEVVENKTEAENPAQDVAHCDDPEIAPAIQREPPLEPPQSLSSGGNVVALWPHRFAETAAGKQGLAESPFQPSAPSDVFARTQANSASQPVELTPDERKAFSDIARALGAKPLDAEALAQKNAALTPANDPGEGVQGLYVLASNEGQDTASGDATPVAAERTETTLEIPRGDEDDPLDRDGISRFESRIPTVVVSPANPVETPAPPVDAPLAAIQSPHAVAQAEIAIPDNVNPPQLDDDVRRNAPMLLEKIPFGVMVTRLETPIYLNQALLDTLGFVSADLFHQSGGLERLFHGRQPETLTNAANGGSIPVVTASGDVIPVEARLRVIDWDGAPATLMSFRKPNDMDLLPHVRSLEAELRAGETQNRELHAILDTATDGVAVLDQSGRILSLNRSAEALFGCEQNEVAGELFTTLLAPESRDSATEYFAGIQAAGVASLLNDGRDVTARASQGGLIPIFLTLGSLGADGRKYCAVMRDMTHWKKAENELRDARREAERASQMKSDFLAKISHEIRTPLNAILGFSEVIMEERLGPIGNERYKDYLKDIHASGAHVMSLVNDLLDLSKIEAGKADLSFTSVDANRIVAECVSIIQPQAAAERVVVRMSLAPRLPRIVADERSLRQIMLNLLSNAVKFNEPGGQVIVSSALTDSGNAVLRVKDTGVGMTDAEVKIALEPFMQLQTSRTQAGTGLGLPLTKALVEANRASFSIRSRKNEGTLVEVAFPAPRVLTE